ncbi:MAG: imidazole glycerol phosphate synthase subunit HisH [Bacteroidetes bacterium]|nr:imidazole glycerol phosphate synthase subunit HisH [Bacteroidota bacterium]
MKTAVIRYNAGNIRSLCFALEKMSVPYTITDRIDEIQSADKVIFPGVGEASSTMNFLKGKQLDQVIKNLNQPVLGICLGMQLMCRSSEENNTDCLGIFDCEVKRIPQREGIKVPHMGWNRLTETSDWIPKRLKDAYFYFVHSYYVPAGVYTSASVNHGTPISAALRKDNFYAVQFHPEKSGDQGLVVLKTFLDL